MISKRYFIIFNLSLLIYAIVFVVALFHNTHVYDTSHNALIQDVPHKTVKPVFNQDPQPVTDPNGRVTSLLKPEKDYVVPNVVHYIWYGDHEPLKFHQYLSIRSVFTFLEPDKVIFHYSHIPVGGLWRQLQQFIEQHNDNSDGKPWILEMRQSIPPSSIQGQEVTLMGHKADVASMQILLEEGGIFLDLDVLVVKSFDPLRMYNFTMGIEYFGTPGRLNNGIVLARPNASFLHKWIESYKDFSKSEWDVHSSQVPYNLQFQYPFMIHVEEKYLNYPSGKDIELIYEDIYDWSHNYALRLWSKIHDLEHGPHAIRTMNTTFGEVARLVYYGSSKLLPPCQKGEKGKLECPT